VYPFLKIDQGSVVCIVGAKGAGKTPFKQYPVWRDHPTERYGFAVKE
jgi:hypothetical protein